MAVDPAKQVAREATSRRAFLGASGAAVALGSVAPAVAAQSVVGHAGGDQRLRIGVIGCGGRGRGACKDALTAGDDVVIVAMADAFEDRLEECHRILAEQFGDRIEAPKERRFHGFDAYRSVLQADVDLVILATPPGFRPIHFRAAVDAGKHVFMEKPVAVDPAGVRSVLAAAEAAKSKSLAVAVGLQRRHEAHYQDTIQRIWDGAVGDEVLYTRVYWNSHGVWTRPRQPEQTEMEYQMRNWYYFNWLCGDHIVEQHIHNLDVSNWLKRMTPVEANGMGGRQVRTGADHGQIYDHHAVEYTYPDGTKMLSQCRHVPDAWTAVGEFAHGALGHSHVGKARVFDRLGKITHRLRGKLTPGFVQEHVDLQAAIKSGTPYNEAVYGAEATMTAILGRMATYSGQVVKWDEALQSDLDLSPSVYAFDAAPPVLPDSRGRYPVAVPGQSSPAAQASAAKTPSAT